MHLYTGPRADSTQFRSIPLLPSLGRLVLQELRLPDVALDFRRIERLSQQGLVVKHLHTVAGLFLSATGDLVEASHAAFPDPLGVLGCVDRSRFVGVDDLR